MNAMFKKAYIILPLTAIFLVGCVAASSASSVKTLTALSAAPSSDITSVLTVSLQTEAADAANGSLEAESAPPEFTVTELDETKTMYASDSVNVRTGPSTDYERVGFLAKGQEVTVMGQADTKWYEIEYDEDRAFVSNKYLQDEALAGEASTNAALADQTQETEAQAAEPSSPSITEAANVAGVIMVGDSRFVQMQASVGDNPCTWIAESAKGYVWFSENAVPRIDGCAGKGSKILINLGVNDPGNLTKYISLVNAKADEWTGKGATVYYSSVNPVWENPYVTEEQVEYFNSQMQSSLNGNVHWLDSHSYLNSVGYRLVDGLHYSAETYQTLYAYYMNNIG